MQFALVGCFIFWKIKILSSCCGQGESIMLSTKDVIHILKSIPRKENLEK